MRLGSIIYKIKKIFYVKVVNFQWCNQLYAESVGMCLCF